MDFDLSYGLLSIPSHGLFFIPSSLSHKFCSVPAYWLDETRIHGSDLPCQKSCVMSFLCLLINENIQREWLKIGFNLNQNFCWTFHLCYILSPTLIVLTSIWAGQVLSNFYSNLLRDIRVYLFFSCMDSGRKVVMCSNQVSLWRTEVGSSSLLMSGLLFTNHWSFVVSPQHVTVKSLLCSLVLLNKWSKLLPKYLI